MTRVLKLGIPTVGKVEFMKEAEDAAMICWVPADGLSYNLTVCRVPGKIEKGMGAPFIVSLGGSGVPETAYPVGPLSLYHVSWVMEKWKIGKMEDAKVLSSLLNWSMGTAPISKKYAMETMREVMVAWEAS